eukprot:SAG31_NODE_28418_length_410_cov_1.318328_1_plen_75_part_01
MHSSHIITAVHVICKMYGLSAKYQYGRRGADGMHARRCADPRARARAAAPRLRKTHLGWAAARWIGGSVPQVWHI